jgi:hypothetical protein
VHRLSQLVQLGNTTFLVTQAVWLIGLPVYFSSERACFDAISRLLAVFPWLSCANVAPVPSVAAAAPLCALLACIARFCVESHQQRFWIDLIANYAVGAYTAVGAREPASLDIMELAIICCAWMLFMCVSPRPCRAL